MKKTLLLTLGALALASGTLLASCDNSPKSSLKVDLSEQVAKKTAITVWMDDSTGTYFQKIKEEFAKVEKNIILKTQKVGNVESIEHLKLKGPSGNGADVIQFPHDKLARVVSQDLALALDGSILDYAKERTSESTMKLTQFADPESGIKKYFALPKEQEAPGLYYNKSLIQKEEIPTTFEEIVKKFAEYKASHQDSAYFTNDFNWTNVYGAQAFLTPYGFKPFGENGEDAQNIGFDTPAYKEGLTYLRSLQTPFSIPGDGNTKGSELFVAGKAPLVYAGPWKHSDFEKAHINYGRVEMPTLNGQKMNPFMGAQMVSIYKHTRYQEESKKFLKFLLSDQAARITWEVQGKVAALKPELLAKVEGLDTNEVVQAMSKDMQTAVPMPAIKEIEHFWGPGETALKSLYSSSDSVDAIAKAADDSYKKSAQIK